MLENGESPYRVLAAKARRQYGFLIVSMQEETLNAFSFSFQENWTQPGKNCVLLMFVLPLMKSTCFILSKDHLKTKTLIQTC